MRSAAAAQQQHRVVEYDSLRRRVWILGQRLHHGATGSVLATLGCVGLLSEPARLLAAPASPSTVSVGRVAPLFALAATGGALMAHDWKDHSIWFERGRGTQP